MAKHIDYTTKDYEGYRQDMIDLIQKIMPEWTDHSPNDPGIVLLELLAYQLDKLSYYNDRVANEVFLSTATMRRSVINHCKLIGYELGWATPARHWQVFEIEPQPEDTLIPAGFQVGTEGSDVEEPIIFETVEDLVIPAGMTGLEKDENGDYIYKVEVQHGQRIENEYIGTVEDDEQYQRFRLQYYPVLKDSIQVYVEEPTGRYEWKMVDDFISSTQDDRHYRVEMDEYDRVFVEFGTGASGKIPSAPADVYVSYIVGGGEEGNVGADTIIEFYDSIPGLVSTTNPYGPHVMGRDVESIEHAKIHAPASLKRLDRYVTLADYEEGLKYDFPGIVAKVKAINKDGNVELYILNHNGEPLTQEQREQIELFLFAKSVLFVEYSFGEPTFVPVDLDIEILIHTNFDEDVVKYSAENSLREAFSIENIEFGKDITLAEIYRTLMEIEGVRNILIKSPVEDIEIGETAVPKLNEIQITVRR